MNLSELRPAPGSKKDRKRVGRGTGCLLYTSTLLSASTLSPELADIRSNGGNIEAAKRVGELVAKKALEKGIRQVVFDRGGYLYHGRVAALADAARAAGLEF